MYKKLRITVEGKTYDVTVEELAENGHSAAYSPVAGTSGAPLAAPQPAAPPPAPSPVPAATVTAGAGDEVCPLGGVVDLIEVKVGQAVAEGDKIAVIEAMKMKTPVYAHRSGTVASIAVKPGDPVEAGHILLSIG
ncbi:MAG: acetyl-CoA carboxylase biotin carboxyl carrier protein subunit [Magnetospirillum sp.]|nr:acetyl-CoA carboxylase biotin carboxyl carrier protein subunit [Magnetospirillum sp.]